MAAEGYVALAAPSDAPALEDTTAALRALLGGLLLEFACSGVLAFGAFGEDVRARLGASEAQLQLIASAGLVGITLSALPGAVYDRRGATATTAAGAGLLLAGYGLSFATLARRWPWPLFLLGWFLVGHAGSWLYTTALVANVANFAPELRGYVAGACTAFFGLSIATLVTLYSACLGDASCAGPRAVFGAHVERFVGAAALALPALALGGLALGARARALATTLPSRMRS